MKKKVTNDENKIEQKNRNGNDRNKKNRLRKTLKTEVDKTGGLGEVAVGLKAPAQ